MKKSSLLKIILLVVVVILIVTFVFHLVYFSKFNGNVRLITNQEKIKVVEILRQNMDITGVRIEFGKVYEFKSDDLVQIIVVGGDFKEHYFVDLSNGRIEKK